MKSRTLSAISIAMVVALNAVGHVRDNRHESGPKLPVYEVPRSVTPIAVDGKLDEAVWAKATVAELVLNADGSPSRYPTTARLLFDDSFLYISFRSIDDNIWATRRQRDEHLWEEEVVEVFLQPDPQETSYVELEVNPLGAMLDIYLLDIRKPLRYESWNSKNLSWAVQVKGTVDGKGGDREWTCEIAFPLADAVTAPHLPPRAGDHWRMNLYRVESRPAPALMAWSPTFKDDFHLPNSFGELVFTDKKVR
jgi:hypothetical protein